MVLSQLFPILSLLDLGTIRPQQYNSLCQTSFTSFERKAILKWTRTCNNENQGLKIGDNEILKWRLEATKNLRFFPPFSPSPYLFSGPMSNLIKSPKSFPLRPSKFPSFRPTKSHKKSPKFSHKGNLSQIVESTEGIFFIYKGIKRDFANFPRFRKCYNRVHLRAKKNGPHWLGPDKKQWTFSMSTISMSFSAFKKGRCRYFHWAEMGQKWWSIESARKPKTEPIFQLAPKKLEIFFNVQKMLSEKFICSHSKLQGHVWE
jgi:hypothetical protein